MCALRRSKHSVYDLKYHFVWIPKCRKQILTPEVAEYAQEVFRRVAEEYDMIIDTLEVVEDHVHVFLEAPTTPEQEVELLRRQAEWLRQQLDEIGQHVKELEQEE
jgi:REP element-mobilizing transposase RayT